ncbi:MAG: branched-chain-amino-acid transaminase [Armatimonadetes bacterium]|nr:branched-chain-amino-acid transaminase [Armatimonadota bacterium]
MSLKIWLNGELIPEDEAKVSVFDHGLLYGDGVFEGIRAYNGRIFRLEQHIARLERSAQAIMLDIGLTHEEMCRATVEACRANEVVDGYIRFVVTRGVGDLGLDPRKCSQPTIFIIAANLQMYPEELYEKGLALITCSTRRNSPSSLDPSIKSLNYLNNILAHIECNHAGVAEGIMLTQMGMVSECTGDNIFIVSGGVLHTPPVEAGILDGITRGAVIEIAREMDIECRERMFTITDVYAADECFLTGTGAELVPVIEVDGRTIGEGKPGPTTKRLLEGFRQLTGSEGTSIYD